MLTNWAHLEEIRTRIDSHIKDVGWSVAANEAKRSEWIKELDPAKKTAKVYLRDSNSAPGECVEIEVEGTVHQSARGTSRGQDH